jgi:hypothetical protein
VDLRAGLEAVVKRKIPRHCRESKPRTPIVQPVAQTSKLIQWCTPSLRVQVSHCITLPLSCAMSLVQLFVAENLLNVLLVLFLDIFLTLSYTASFPLCLPVWRNISYSTFAEFLHLRFYISFSFQTPSVLHSYRMVLLRISVSKFCFVFLILSGLLAKTSRSVCTPWFRSTVHIFTYRLRYVCVPGFWCFDPKFLVYWVMQMCSHFITTYDLFIILQNGGQCHVRWSVVSWYYFRSEFFLK